MSKVSRYINDNLNFADEYFAIFGKKLHDYGKCFCPFHHNVNTPAAKYYKDSNSLYCYSCKCSYSVYDLLRSFNPSRIDEIASSQVLPEVETKVCIGLRPFVDVDRSLPIGDIIKQILNDTVI